MCISTLKKQKKIFKSSRGARHSTDRPKIVYGVKDTAKINNDLGMLCYIQVENSVFFYLYVT